MSARKTAAITCCSIAIMFGSSARAETPDLSELSLKELVALEVFTSASLVPTQLQKAPGTVHTFERKDFKRFGVRRLDDLLQFVPGLQLNQYRKRHRSIWSRGILNRYNDKMVLIVDGVRVRHLYYSHFSLGENLPLEYIDKVEVILGPASSLYGANAFAGIISITTRDFSQGPIVEASLEAGNHQRKKVTSFYNSEKLQLFGSHLDQDAPFSEDRKSFIGGDVLQPVNEDYSNIIIKYRPLDTLTLKADYNREETPFLNIPNTQDGYVDSDYLNLSARYEYGTIEKGRVEATAYYQKDNIREYELEQTTQRPGYEEYQNGTMAGLSLTGIQQINNHTLAAGLSWQYEKAERTDYTRSFHFARGFLSPPETGNLLSEPGISNNDFAAFAQDIWEIRPDLSLTYGARFDSFERFGDYINHRAALVYSPEPDQTWKLQHGTAIRTPGFREYLKVLEGTSFIPPQVDAERITLTELGYAQQWEEVTLDLNLYQGHIDDFIKEMPTPDKADEYFANADSTYRMKGAEAVLKFRPSAKFNTYLGISYLETDSDTGELPYLASWTGSLQMDYQYRPNHLLGMSLIYNSNREDTNNFDDDSDAFSVINVFGSGHLSPQLEYRFGIDNLLDKAIYDPAADFGTQHNDLRSEREIWLGLTWRSDFL